MPTHKAPAKNAPVTASNRSSLGLPRCLLPLQFRPLLQHLFDAKGLLPQFSSLIGIITSLNFILGILKYLPAGLDIIVFFN